MKKEDIAIVAHDTILNFPKRIEEPAILFLPKQRFSKYLNLMQLQKHLEKTPCFMAKMKGGNVIYFCKEIVTTLTKDLDAKEKKQFIEAITLHELLHIYNHLHVFTGEDAMHSEQLVEKELKIFYPSHYKLLQQFREAA